MPRFDAYLRGSLMCAVDADPCVICGGSPRPFRAGPKGQVLRCTSCGFAYRAQRPTVDTLLEMYRDDHYFALGQDRGVGYADYISDEQMYRRYFARKAHTLALLRPPPGSLFEIGCAAGFFLSEAQRRGWTVAGSELSARAARHASELVGAPVAVAAVHELSRPEQPYDVIAAFQTLEHVPDVRAMLDWIRAALAPGGVLMLTTPDLASIPSRVLGARWPSYRPEHLWYFDRVTLPRLLRSCGFTGVRVRGDTPLLVPLARVKERLRHYFGVDAPLPDRLGCWTVPVWLGDMEVTASTDTSLGRTGRRMR